MKNETPRDLKRRSTISFTILILGAVILTSLWYWVRSAPEVDGTPAPFRQVLEVNGKIWKGFFRAGRTDRVQRSPVGRKPRVNGDIGLKGEVHPETWKLEVIADDQDPQSKHLTLNLKELMALPRTESASGFRCIEGWSEDMSFAGIKFSDFMRAYELSPKAYVGLQTTDGEYYVSIDMESMMHEQTLLAFEMNGLPLAPENGAPLRLVIPVKYGIKNLKRIGKIFFSDVRPPDYWAEQGYDWYAGL